VQRNGFEALVKAFNSNQKKENEKTVFICSTKDLKLNVVERERRSRTKQVFADKYNSGYESRADFYAV
jgi:hypothetical protein